jgi:ATP-dependent Lhr-like helicase
MRFLFAWQHVSAADRLAGVDGLRAAIEQLSGFEAPAAAWERAILPARVERYESTLLDTLCLVGDVSWARASAPEAVAGDAPVVVAATPIALFPREEASVWIRGASGAVASDSAASGDCAPSGTDQSATRRVLDYLTTRGASFAPEIAAGCALDAGALRAALARLVGAGAITSDGFGGLRALLSTSSARQVAGRWSLLSHFRTDTPEMSRLSTGVGPRSDPGPTPVERDPVERQAWGLLRRYGVLFRRLLTREPTVATWRELSRFCRRLEARGEIRGGRFVAGMSGEQFALPAAVERLRELRRTLPDGKLIAISAADPLNLAGIVTAGDRVRAHVASRVLYMDGVPLAALEGDYMRPLTEVPPAMASQVATTLAGRAVPAVVSGYIGRTG